MPASRRICSATGPDTPARRECARAAQLLRRSNRPGRFRSRRRFANSTDWWMSQPPSAQSEQDSRMKTGSAEGQRSRTAVDTSRAKRIRFSKMPPYWSARWLDSGDREGMDQIAVGAVQFGYLETRLKCTACAGGEILHYFLDLIHAELNRAGVAWTKRDGAGREWKPTAFTGRDCRSTFPGHASAGFPCSACASCIPATEPCSLTNDATAAKGAIWSSVQMPMSPAEIRPRASTAVASTITSAAPPMARLPRCTGASRSRAPRGRNTGTSAIRRFGS